MNTHFAPNRRMRTERAQTSFALATASHGADYERCRLLCETVDQFVTGTARHYILVAGHDVELFRRLEGPGRFVVDEREVLPSWLRAFRDPFSLGRRHVWLSTRVWPLRGWHVQQLRRIGLAELADEDVLVFCDSDVAFVRSFDATSLAGQDGVRLFRRDGGLAPDAPETHRAWVANAGHALNLPPFPPRPQDYIATLIAWRRQTVRDMCRHIERVHHRHWAAVIAARRRFSECMLYGRYVDEVIEGAGHRHCGQELCRVMWQGSAPDDAELRRFLDSMGPEQVAVGIQSFIGVTPNRLRRLFQAASD